MSIRTTRSWIRRAAGVASPLAAALALSLASASALAAVLGIFVAELQSRLPPGLIHLERPTVASEARPAPPRSGRRVTASAEPRAPSWVREPTTVERLAEAVCEPAARLACEARVRCGCVRPDPTCEETVYAACTVWLARGLEEMPDGPGVEIEPAGIARVLGQIEQLGARCDSSDGLLDAGLLIRATTEIGGSCAPDLGRCRRGLCLPDGSYRSPVELSCRAAPSEGEAAIRLRCAAGLVVGESRVCERPPRLGERCEATGSRGGLECADGRWRAGANRGERCWTTEDCAWGLTCASPPGSGGRCAPAPIWCDRDEVCGAGQLCVGVARSACVPAGGAPTHTGACRDGRVCARGERCVERNEGRCEATICETEVLAGTFSDPREFGDPRELGDPFAGLDL